MPLGSKKFRTTSAIRKSNNPYEFVRQLRLTNNNYPFSSYSVHGKQEPAELEDVELDETLAPVVMVGSGNSLGMASRRSG